MSDTLGFVFVHGALHSGAMWAPVLPLLERPSVAVDLPRPGDRRLQPAASHLDAFVDTVVDAIDSAPFERVVLVGHSLAGITLPGVAARRPQRLARLVYISCPLPPPGRSVLDTLPRPVRIYTRHRIRTGVLTPPPRAAARSILAHDLDAGQRARFFAQLHPDTASPITTPVDSPEAVCAVPQTYVLLLRDRALPLRTQRRQLRQLTTPDLAAVDAGHEVTFSRPEALAAVLNTQARSSLQRVSVGA